MATRQLRAPLMRRPLAIAVAVSLAGEVTPSEPVNQLRYNMAVQARVHAILTQVRRGQLDAAAALVGSIGLIPSASFGSGAPLFEPIHGSAPTLAGKDCANPIGSILSATMMLRDAFGLNLEADWVEQSVIRALSGGYRTPDLAAPGTKTVGTAGFMEILHDEMQRTLEHAERYGWGV